MDNTINIFLKEREDYINSFNQERISTDLDEYILNETKTFNPKRKVTVNISSNFNIGEDEQEKIKRMIKASYRDDIKELKLYRDNLLRRDFLILLIGILILVIYYLFLDYPVINEIILIVGWITVYESIYSLLFSRTELNIKIRKRKQLINSKIIFK